MNATESRVNAAEPGSREHARAVLRAQERLRTDLGPQLAGDGSLSVLLFLFAEGGGISTAACCAASAAPRTTALRWITALAGAGWIAQVSDMSDRRVTLLQLTDRAQAAVHDWLLAMAGVI